MAKKFTTTNLPVASEFAEVRKISGRYFLPCTACANARPFPDYWECWDKKEVSKPTGRRNPIPGNTDLT